MQKYYEVKIYDWKGNFKKQINSKNITSKIEFSENINGVQGNITIDIIGIESDFLESDIVEVRESQEVGFIKNIWDDLDIWNDLNIWEDKKSFIAPTYTGIIERIGVKEYKYNQIISIEVLGVGTALNDIIYNHDINTKVFTKTDTLGNIAIDIINYFNSHYATLTDTQNLGNNLFYYDSDSIDITGDTVSIEFDHDNCYESLEKLTDDTDFFFFIDSTGKVTFKKTNDIKILTFERELISIDRKTKKDEMVNKFYLHRDGGHGLEEIYENLSSQATYGLKELHEDNSDIQDVITQDLMGNTRVAEYGVPRVETTLIIQAQKSDFLYPGMYITTQNTKNPITNMRVTKIDKRSDLWTLYLGDYTSFGKVFLQR